MKLETAGRATVELMKILTQPEKAEGVLYGDNAAAVSMHSPDTLKFSRATALRELLQKEQWELRHLKGAELVADGWRAWC